MKFMIERTSLYEGEPIDGCNVETVTIHGLPRIVYTMEISSLDDLIKFVEKLKEEIVISAPDEFSWLPLPTIEIYDDYRE